MHVPRHVSSVEHANLPKDLPIVGLGCSSFSAFLWSKDEEASMGGSWTPRTHPKVQEWIGTIHYDVEELYNPAKHSNVSTVGINAGDKVGCGLISMGGK